MTKQVIFTFCTINKNLFDLIFYRWSCKNIIGKHIVDKLKLPLEPHPEPYKIKGLSQYNR